MLYNLKKNLKRSHYEGWERLSSIRFYPFLTVYLSFDWTIHSTSLEGDIGLKMARLHDTRQMFNILLPNGKMTILMRGKTLTSTCVVLLTNLSIHLSFQFFYFFLVNEDCFQPSVLIFLRSCFDWRRWFPTCSYIHFIYAFIQWFIHWKWFPSHVSELSFIDSRSNSFFLHFSHVSYISFRFLLSQH